MTTFDKYSDVIYSRDIIARIQELQEMQNAHIESPEDYEALDAEEVAELKALEELADDCKDYSDWEYGETLIRRSYFVEYAQELAEDCGLVNPDAKWPNTCIDWDQAARELEMDYSVVEFDGIDFLIRSC